MEISPDSLKIDLEVESLGIVNFIRKSVVHTFRKRGAVVAVSGGIDSATTTALCLRALGPDRVFALLLPDRDSSEESTRLGRVLVEHLGIAHQIVDIEPILAAMGCYVKRDEAIREVFPEYSPAFKNKIVLPLLGATYNYYTIVIETPGGEQKSKRLPLRNYLQIVAATNMKQRTRKSLEYFHADRLNYAVAGTPNFLEYDQGFFVKLGDGAADIKPIAHLYKSQVYAMAEYLGLPVELRKCKPTTDTYSLQQSQEELYFRVPHDKLDLILFGMSRGLGAERISEAAGIPCETMEQLIRDIRQKRVTTAPLHLQPLTFSRRSIGRRLKSAHA